MTKLSKHPITIIFDFDGTIADTFSFYFVLLNKLAEKFKFNKIQPDRIEYYRSLSSHKIFEELKVPTLKLLFIVLEARKYLKKEIRHISPIDGIKEILFSLKTQDILIGIITSNSVKNVNLFLEKNKFPKFDFVFSSLRIWEKSKTLKKFLFQNKLDPQSIFYIGDETRDIEAAHEAGVKSIAVTWGYNSEVILKNYFPEYIATTPQNLLDIIKNILSKSESDNYL